MTRMLMFEMVTTDQLKNYWDSSTDQRKLIEMLFVYHR